MARSTMDREVLADIQSMKDEVEKYAAQVADPTATSVNLAGRVVFDMAVMTRFVERLWLAQSLHTLSLGFCLIDDDTVQVLNQCLRENVCLKQLRLAGNHIGDIGAKSLADMLMVNSTLQLLDLSDNKITRVGAADLAEALEDHNRSIHTLSVSFNRIHAVGAQELLYALAFNPTITNLNLHGNSIGDCECIPCAEIGRGEMFGWIMSSNTYLRTLDIGGNALERGTRIHLARCMLANPSLQLRSLVGVDLRDCVRPLHYPPEMRTWKQYRLLTFFRENPTGENSEEHTEHHEKRLRERVEFKEDRRQKRLEAKERAAMAIEDEISSQLDEAIVHMKRLYVQIAAAEAAAKKNARSWAVSQPRVAASQDDGSSVGGSTATPKKRRPTNATVTSRAGTTTRARRGTNTTAVSGAGSGVGAGAASAGGRRRSSAERRRSNATRRRSNVSNAASGT